jgi:hypothetical protein
MITNPKVGRRVRMINPIDLNYRGREGVITRVSSFFVDVRFDNETHSRGGFYHSRFEYVLTAEELDQQNRQKHADKYL